MTDYCDILKNNIFLVRSQGLLSQGYWNRSVQHRKDQSEIKLIRSFDFFKWIYLAAKSNSNYKTFESWDEMSQNSISVPLARPLVLLRGESYINLRLFSFLYNCHVGARSFGFEHSRELSFINIRINFPPVSLSLAPNVPNKSGPADGLGKAGASTTFS